MGEECCVEMQSLQIRVGGRRDTGWIPSSLCFHPWAWASHLPPSPPSPPLWDWRVDGPVLQGGAWPAGAAPSALQGFDPSPSCVFTVVCHSIATEARRDISWYLHTSLALMGCFPDPFLTGAPRWNEPMTFIHCMCLPLYGQWRFAQRMPTPWTRAPSTAKED